MTSNVGAIMSDKNIIGFNQAEQFHDPSGEFLNFIRGLDAVISFNRLDHENLLHIVDKQLNVLEKILREKKIELKCSDGAKKWLIEHGYDVKMGARPIKKLIDKSIKSSLADLLLKGKVKKGGSVVIKTKGKDIEILSEKDKSKK